MSIKIVDFLSLYIKNVCKENYWKNKERSSRNLLYLSIFIYVLWYERFCVNKIACFEYLSQFSESDFCDTIHIYFGVKCEKIIVIISKLNRQRSR